MKTFVLESFFSKGLGLKAYNCIKKNKPTQVFSCEYCEIFKNSFIHRTPLVAAAVLHGIFKNGR